MEAILNCIQGLYKRLLNCIFGDKALPGHLVARLLLGWLGSVPLGAAEGRERARRPRGLKKTQGARRPLYT